MRKSIVIAALATAALLVSCSGNKDYEYPFQNPKLSVDRRVDNLISLLTPEEKVGLMMNGSISVDRLGIPAYNWWSEACHGICANGATVFPQAIGLAATFDPDQQFEIYTAVSDEARAHWNITDHNQFGKTKATGGAWHQGLTFWCPNINIVRDPRWGRGQETSGEDPFLSGTMGTATVKGMQGNDKKYLKTHACAKHYAVHSGPESSRHRDDVSVSQRDLWETYLPAFKKLVQVGKVQEVMGAYNRYEGDPCCASERLMVDILRDKWGFDGFVVSDCGAINNFYTKGQHETHPDAATASAAAVKAGTDVECGTSYNALLEAMEKGMITEDEIDVSLRRVLSARIKLGTLDPVEMDPWAALGEETLSSPEHNALAEKAAREAMVLLKNNGVLPLSKDIRKIAVVGPNADNVSMHLGNYNGTPTAEHTLSIVDAIRQAVPDAVVYYEKACELVDQYMTVNHMSDFNAGRGLHVDYYGNTSFSGEKIAENNYTEAYSKHTMGDYRFEPGMPGNNFSARLTGTIIPDFTGDLYYTLRSSDTYKFIVNGKVVDEQKSAQPGVRYSRNAPVSTTSFPVVAGKAYDVTIEYAKGEEGSAFLSVDFFHRYAPDFAALSEKVKDADAIIVVSGLSARLEGEEMPVHYDGFSGGDRTRIELPEIQKQLIAAMDATGKPVVLVNCSGSAIGFGELETQYDALLQAWYAGEAMGHAVADILFGGYNPAGRLPVTFYASTAQLPDFKDYSMEGRTYRYFKGQPLYAFGYGLSYTTFEYGKAKVSGKKHDVTVTVKNTGDRDGEEVVQLYVKSLDNPDAPIKSLKGFKRVSIPAGQSVKVKITLGDEAFEYYDESVDGLAVKPGRYQILYGGSSRDEDLKSIDLTI